MVMVNSFHLRDFLRSLCSWCADISLCNMKLMVGGKSVRIRFWEICNRIVL